MEISIDMFIFNFLFYSLFSLSVHLVMSISIWYYVMMIKIIYEESYPYFFVFIRNIVFLYDGNPKLLIKVKVIGIVGKYGVLVKVILIVVEVRLGNKCF